MAKQLGRFQIVITGTEADGPQEALVVYDMQDATDPELRKSRTKVLESPDFSKKFYDTNITGEFWKDEVAAVKATEGL